MVKEFDALIAARKILDAFWNASLLRGRCWGPRKNGNPFRASNITFTSGPDSEKTELVSVLELPDGSLRIHEFVLAKGTKLGALVRQRLEANGLTLERKGEC